MNPSDEYSGGPGTTGREVFEDSTATGPASRYAVGGTGTGAGAATGPGATAGVAGAEGHHGHHHHGHHGHHGHHHDQSTLGSAGTTGTTTYDNAGAAGTTPSGQYGSVSNSATHHHHSHENDGHKFGATGAATGVGAATATGAGAGVGSGASTSGGPVDRVGSLNQGGAAYERSGIDGPATHGAAGTDRFDTDKSAGVGAGAGSGVKDTAITRAAEQATGGTSAPGTARDGPVDKVLGTSSGDFTGENRGTGLSSGAYTDEAGAFQKNTSGPGGNTALTGREGTAETNPVAQAQSRTGTSGTTGGTADSTPAGTPAKNSGASQTGSEKKKGIFQKIKDALD